MIENYIMQLEKRQEQNIRSHGNMNENLKKQSVKI